MSEVTDTGKQRARRTRWMMIIAAVALIAAGIAWITFSSFSQTQVAKWRLNRYLKSQAANRDFTAKYPFPSAAEMAGGAADTNALATNWLAFSKDMRVKMTEAATYGAMYQLVGQQLWVANRLFDSKNPQHLRLALQIARHAIDDATTFAQNGWLAARICEAYLLPNLAVLDKNSTRELNYEGVISDCARILAENGEADGVVRVYLQVLSQNPSPPRADWAHAQIALTAERQGDLDIAIRHGQQIKNTNAFSYVVRRVPGWQSKTDKRN